MTAPQDPLVTEFVKTHVNSTGLDHSPEEIQRWGKTMSAVLKKPLSVLQAPFQSFDLTSGLSDTAVAMHRFTDEFSRARTGMEYLPREVRWNTQLLLMELNETLDLTSVTAGVAELGSSASSLSETARTLPEAELPTAWLAHATAGWLPVPSWRCPLPFHRHCNDLRTLGILERPSDRLLPTPGGTQLISNV